MNTSNYATLIQENLRVAFEVGAVDLAARLDVGCEADKLVFKAFGGDCELSRGSVRLVGQNAQGPRGVIISLLARHASVEACIEAPWQAFRELPDSMPYVAAFRSHTELPLISHVEAIMAGSPSVAAAMGGREVTQPVAGDAALILQPLPKIRLCYLLYRPDDEFPANVTCLFAANAHRFLPTDALADVGEYTSRAMIAALAGRLR